MVYASNTVRTFNLTMTCKTVSKSNDFTSRKKTCLSYTQEAKISPLKIERSVSVSRHEEIWGNEDTDGIVYSWDFRGPEIVINQYRDCWQNIEREVTA